MATLLKIPIQADLSDQTLNVELDGSPYILRVLWNERFGYFSFSMAGSDGLPILTNLKMVKNYPLIGRFKNDLLPSGEIYFVQEVGDEVRPTYDCLATNCNLYYYQPDLVSS